MDFEIRLIEALQNAGNRVLDILFFALTLMGDKLFFIVVAALIYWCFSKKFAFRFINVYIFCSAVTEALKAIFRRPRPFAATGRVRAIFEKTHGWSFPSGHSISISGMGTQISQKALKEKKHFKTSVIISIMSTLLVMLSRMYLGQHYLTDVVAGAIFGVVFAILFGYAFDAIDLKETKFWIVVLPLSVLVLTILLVAGAADGESRTVQALGAYAAVCIGYSMEKRFVDYEVKSGAIWKQAVKVLLGLSIAVLIMLGGEAIISLIGNDRMAAIISYILYFGLGMQIMLLSPYIFKKLKI